MLCACYHQPLPASTSVLNRHAKQTGSLGTKQVFLFLSSSPSTSSLRGHQWQICNYPKIGLRLKPKASVVPPSESGDITTFLLVRYTYFISALQFISIYWEIEVVICVELFTYLQCSIDLNVFGSELCGSVFAFQVAPRWRGGRLRLRTFKSPWFEVMLCYIKLFVTLILAQFI